MCDKVDLKAISPSIVVDGAIITDNLDSDPVYMSDSSTGSAEDVTEN